ncbi:sugar phosphate isomerase/epimerase family protein [Sporocytophaga myxococcoides]|uniref:sugar phosphate isomerase/epimerase family protein n=1 Tax=Sporocytophaga myxococcoides TaxID=153721 RepID=UPI00040882C2|nr:sugar phosphate isomerase/epimerase family protein [Sporocytophaga myxococcoides]
MTKDRRTFIKEASIVAGGLTLLSSVPSGLFAADKFDFKISLAQWSLHKAMFSGKLTTLDFALIAKKEFGLDAVEYVNQFFADKAKDQEYLKNLKQRAEDNGVKSLLIMVDNEGSLSSTVASERKTAVENHYKWVDAAKFLGCHSIRVNLHGAGSDEEWKSASIEGLGKLAEYGANHKMNVIVENHGQHSSNGALLAEVIKQINNPFCGTLPDFGNFCMRREKGDLWESPCVEWYDRYKGVKEMLPYAKGVSAKAFNFDSKGNEQDIDFKKMLELVKASGYKGYIGIEYEGEMLDEYAGIKATKKLLEKVRAELK